ncbi:MAG: YbaB/EbfC family nucleoid-associated protein [Actinobacteria bacterium]|nr:YbaB/EbfC family nucleoid-associated protein [Actinomycetota bacterium]
MAKKPHRRVPGGFPGGMRPSGGMPSLESLARRAAEMQEQLEAQRAALAERTFTGTAGGGAVTVVMRGSGELESVRFDPAVLDPADPEMAGDLVVAAVNQALRQIQEAAAASIDLGPGGPGPGGLGLDDLRGLLG